MSAIDDALDVARKNITDYVRTLSPAEAFDALGNLLDWLNQALRIDDADLLTKVNSAAFYSAIGLALAQRIVKHPDSPFDTKAKESTPDFAEFVARHAVAINEAIVKERGQ